MKIAFIGQKGLELGEKGGGIEQHVAALSRHLVLFGHEVVVYGRRRYGGEQERTRVNKGEQGGGKGKLTMINFPTIYTKNLEAIVHTFMCTIHALFQGYDVIHYHGVGPSTLAWIPRLLAPRTRVVATFHSQDRFHQKWGWFARAYLHFGEWATCRFPQSTIVVSHVLQVYARNRYNAKTIYIPNGAEPQTIRTREALSIFGLRKNKYILNVSRLIPHKGQHYLIPAFLRLKDRLGERGKDWKLVIVGASSYTNVYERDLHSLAGGDPSIIFAGYQSGTRLWELFGNAYLYVQPSESEGLPVSVIEAMSVGTPVLVSDIPENLEAIDHVGFSFENRSIADLAERLEDLVRHPSQVKQSAERVRGFMERTFSWEHLAREVEQVYKDLDPVRVKHTLGYEASL